MNEDNTRVAAELLKEILWAWQTGMKEATSLAFWRDGVL